MRPLSALLVALLFVTATAVPVAGLTTTPDRTDTAMLDVTMVENTTNHLSLAPTEVRQAEHSSPGVDVGTAVKSGSDQLRHRQDQLTFEQRFQRADSDARRTTLVTNQISTVESQQTALDRRQDTAIAQYAAGEITASEFLRIRLLVNAEATELLSTLESIGEVSNTVAGYSLSSTVSTRVRTAEGDLEALTGPVGDRLQSQATGASSQNAVYVEASDTGYMLATIDDEYLRETRLDSERDSTLPDQFRQAAQNDSETDQFSAADDRASELYTWLYERQRPSFTFYGTSGIYELTASHSNGQLTSYIDAGTRNVFYEEQQRDLSDIQTTETKTAVNGTVQLTVQRSFETGPMLVSASNADTAASLDGSVTVNDNPVGSTGRDGSVWAVEPSDSYTVTVATDEGQATVTVQEL